MDIWFLYAYIYILFSYRSSFQMNTVTRFHLVISLRSPCCPGCPLAMKGRLQLLWLQILIAIDSEWWKRAFPSFSVSPSGRFWSGCALHLESEQTSISCKGHLFKSTVLHKIWFGTFCLVLKPFSLRDQWMIVKMIQVMRSALVCMTL